MKKIIPIIVMSSWFIMLILAVHFNLFQLSLNDIKHFIEDSTINPMILFVGIFCARIFLFIPSTMLIVTGSLFFNPIETIILSMVGMFITETIIYGISRSLLSNHIQNYMVTKYPKLNKEIISNGKKYLFITVATPLAPTDGACFIAASTKMPYFSYITTVLAGTIPIVTLYTLYGNFLIAAPWVTLCISAPVVIILIVYITIRKKQKNELHYTSENENV
ncbi:VTT domain-containing protein [Bacillus sp. JJ664]